MDAKTIVKRLGLASSILSYGGASALFVMMVLTMADVVGRYLFNAPILGVFELTEFLVLILIFSFLGYTQSHKSHIVVDFLVNRLPKRAQVYIELINNAVCLMLMILITWMGVERALDLKEVDEISRNLEIPVYPFVFYLVLGCGVMCIEYIRDLILMVVSRKEDSAA